MLPGKVSFPSNKIRAFYLVRFYLPLVEVLASPLTPLNIFLPLSFEGEELKKEELKGEGCKILRG